MRASDSTRVVRVVVSVVVGVPSVQAAASIRDGTIAVERRLLSL